MDIKESTKRAIEALRSKSEQVLIDADDLNLLIQCEEDWVEEFQQEFQAQERRSIEDKNSGYGVVGVALAFPFVGFFFGLSLWWLLLCLPAVLTWGVCLTDWWDGLEKRTSAMRPLKHQLPIAKSIERYCSESSAADEYRKEVLKNRTLYGFDASVMQKLWAEVATVNLLSHTPPSAMTSLTRRQELLVDRKNKL
jgi:hypothetical protein